MSHPFFGTYILTFLVWNWKILITITGITADYQTRIQYIENLGLTWYDYVLPLVVTLIYLAVSPYIQNYIEEYNYKRLLLSKNKKQDIFNNVDYSGNKIFDYITIIAREKQEEGQGKFNKFVELTEKYERRPFKDTQEINEAKQELINFRNSMVSEFLGTLTLLGSGNQAQIKEFYHKTRKV